MEMRDQAQASRETEVRWLQAECRMQQPPPTAASGIYSYVVSRPIPELGAFPGDVITTDRTGHVSITRLLPEGSRELVALHAGQLRPMGSAPALAPLTGGKASTKSGRGPGRPMLELVK